MSIDKSLLESIIKTVNKEVSSGSPSDLKDDVTLIKTGDDRIYVDAITTGSIAIDNAIGIGGFPRGRIIEVFGPEASGKTTLTLNTIAAAQANGEVCAFIDAEHALDPKLAIGCGVCWDDLLFVQPNYGEQALSFAEKLILTGKVSVIVIDSVAALIPKQEYIGEIDGKDAPGAQARMMAKGLRKLTGAINKSKCIVIFVNQVREKIGVMFGSHEMTPGGRALKFSCSIRLEAKRIESLRSGKDNVIGNKLRVTVVKNKVAPPYAKAIVDLIYGKGVDNSKDIVDLAVEHGVVKKKGGSWYSYKDIKSNGIDKFLQDIKEDGVFDEIDSETRKLMITIVKPVIVDQEDEEDEDNIDPDDD